MHQKVCICGGQISCLATAPTHNKQELEELCKSDGNEESSQTTKVGGSHYTTNFFRVISSVTAFLQPCFKQNSANQSSQPFVVWSVLLLT